MHESGARSYNEVETSDAESRSPIESALMDLADAQERAEKAVAVLSDRLSSILQPTEPTSIMTGNTISGVVPDPPTSPTLRRLRESTADVSRLASRVNGLMDRLDV